MKIKDHMTGKYPPETDLDYKKSSQDLRSPPRIGNMDSWFMVGICVVCNKLMTPYDQELKRWVQERAVGTGSTITMCHELCTKTNKMKVCRRCERIITPYTPGISVSFRSCPCLPGNRKGKTNTEYRGQELPTGPVKE